MAVAAGSMLGLALTAVIASRVHGITPLNPVEIAGVGFTVTAIFVCSAGVATRTRLRLDPAALLREE